MAIATGYDIYLTEENIQYIRDVISKNTPYNGMDYPFPSVITTGVKFAPHCRGGHDAASKVKNVEELDTWYSKHHQVNCVYVRRIFVTTKFVIGEADAMRDRFYVMLSNYNDSSTTQHKHNIVNGRYGNPIEIERMTLHAQAYIYKPSIN